MQHDVFSTALPSSRGRHLSIAHGAGGRPTVVRGAQEPLVYALQVEPVAARQRAQHIPRGIVLHADGARGAAAVGAGLPAGRQAGT